MELDSSVSSSDLSSLASTLLTELQKTYSALQTGDVVAELLTAGRRRLLSGRPIVRVTVVYRASLVLNYTAAAELIVTKFEDGTIHDLLPSFPVAHAQLSSIGEWTCWFNWVGSDVDYCCLACASYLSMQHGMTQHL